MHALPIDPLLPEIAAALKRGNALVLEAAPGAGKTTRVPAALLAESFPGGREILVLEPRRLAARMAAYRIAEEMGEPIGRTVGYHFRFENVGGPETRLRFYTEGMFLRRLLRDPELRGVGLVILDEFHERHLQGDVALALLRRLQQTSRPELRLLVMSATLDGAAIAQWLDGAPHLVSEGRRFPVDIEYLDLPHDLPMEDRMLAGLERLERLGHRGDVLAFLPGVGEIRRTADRLAARFGGAHDILPLYADLSREEQERAVRPGRRPKVVLATNVAETSITIDGVTAVLDGGVARIPSIQPWTGMPTLRLQRISQASATQRAGRAGRTAPGVCVRLYGSGDHAARPAFEKPEIERLDLAGTLLELAALGATDVDSFPWFTPPPEASLARARTLLVQLGALTDAGTITPLGKRMVQYPAHPRIARLLEEGVARKVGAEAATVAAWISEARQAPDNEVAGLLDARFPREEPALARVRQQFLERMPDSARKRSSLSPTEVESAVRRAVLAGFPDRIGKVREVAGHLSRARSGAGAEVLLAAGGTARLLDPHLPSGTEWVVAVDVEERAQAGTKGDLRLRLVAAMDPDWLLDMDPSPLVEQVEARWLESAKRVEVVSQLRIDRLVLDESKVDPHAAGTASEAAQALLAEKAAAAGLAAFLDVDSVTQWRERVRVAAEAFPELGLPATGEAIEADLLRALAHGRTSFAEIRDADPLGTWTAQLTAEQRRILEEFPDQLRLPGGRRIRIHYEPGRPPWAESRLQDFFGMKATPVLGRGRVPLVLHLLAPNQRAVQVTTDLAGFWARAYPALRKELGRRYPRHSWPEDPLTAEPPKPRGR